MNPIIMIRDEEQREAQYDALMAEQMGMVPEEPACKRVLPSDALSVHDFFTTQGLTWENDLCKQLVYRAIDRDTNDALAAFINHTSVVPIEMKLLYLATFNEECWTDEEEEFLNIMGPFNLVCPIESLYLFSRKFRRFGMEKVSSICPEFFSNTSFEVELPMPSGAVLSRWTTHRTAQLRDVLGPCSFDLLKPEEISDPKGRSTKMTFHDFIGG